MPASQTLVGMLPDSSIALRETASAYVCLVSVLNPSLQAWKVFRWCRTYTNALTLVRKFRRLSFDAVLITVYPAEKVPGCKRQPRGMRGPAPRHEGEQACRLA